MTATISVGLPAGYGQLVAEKDTAPALDLVVAARDAARAYADPLTPLRGVEAVAVLMGMSANTQATFPPSSETATLTMARPPKRNSNSLPA